MSNIIDTKKEKKRYILLFWNRKWEEISEEKWKELMTAEEIQAKKAYYVIDWVTYLSPAEVQASHIVSNILERTWINTQTNFEKWRTIMYVFFAILATIFAYIWYNMYSYMSAFDTSHVTRLEETIQWFENQRDVQLKYLELIWERAKIDTWAIQNMIQEQKKPVKDSSFIFQKWQSWTWAQ